MENKNIRHKAGESQMVSRCDAEIQLKIVTWTEKQI